MCDYFTDPVWWHPSGSGGNLDEVPITEETRAALRAWAESYDTLADNGFEWRSAEAKEAFEREGHRLWGLVQAELGSDWEVGFFDERRGHVLWRRGDPKQAPT
jgi:hypothetical protein